MFGVSWLETLSFVKIQVKTAVTRVADISPIAVIEMFSVMQTSSYLKLVISIETIEGLIFHLHRP